MRIQWYNSLILNFILIMRLIIDIMNHETYIEKIYFEYRYYKIEYIYWYIITDMINNNCERLIQESYLILNNLRLINHDRSEVFEI